MHIYSVMNTNLLLYLHLFFLRVLLAQTLLSWDEFEKSVFNVNEQIVLFSTLRYSKTGINRIQWCLILKNNHRLIVKWQTWNSDYQSIAHSRECVIVFLVHNIKHLSEKHQIFLKKLCNFLYVCNLWLHLSMMLQ